MRGWKGTLGAEILFRIGAKPDGPSDGTRKFSPQEERDLLQYEAREKALAAMYDPDEMPSLDDAGRILFARGEGEGNDEEQEWEEELKSRLVEVSCSCWFDEEQSLIFFVVFVRYPCCDTTFPCTKT
jgi:hypothetical protein